MIPKNEFDKATKIAVFMVQEKSGAGDLIQQLEDFAKKVKLIDDVYKYLKNTQMAKDIVLILLTE